MTRACDLGPGDVWGSPSDAVDHCEHCGVEIEESCCHRRCESCRDTVECCVECQTLLEKLDHVAELTGTYYSDTDRTYYADAREVFAALRERLTLDPDPIAELEAMGGTIQPCWIEGRWELTWFAAAFTAQEPIGEVVRLADLRAAAARLLERVRGGAK